MCDTIKPGFIPSPEIPPLRDLIRYRSKLTNMLTGEKNRAQNCLTVSNLKLDDVFGKSSSAITHYMPGHPDKAFDGAISPQQAVKPRQYLAHIDALEAHRHEFEQEILPITEPFSAILGWLLPTQHPDCL